MVENDELQRCITILNEGGLIVAPTDTVYGLVCDATNETAVKKLIKLKNRPPGKPISVFSDGFQMMECLVNCSNNTALLHNLLPGPFTIVLPSKHTVSLLLESEKGTLGVRFTTSEWIQKLVHQFGKPLTATSANLSGSSPHYAVKDFLTELNDEKKKLIDFVVDHGQLPKNKPSTLVDLSGGTLQLLRKGDLLPLEGESFSTNNAEETKKIAQHFLQKKYKEIKQKPLVFILEGEMGVGKTVFAQGLGEHLGVSHVVSPTYVIYYEYAVDKSDAHLFVHADLYNIEDAEEFTHLGLEEYMKPGVVLCIEWGNRIGPLLQQLKEKALVVVVDLSYISETQRKLHISDLQNT